MQLGNRQFGFGFTQKADDFSYMNASQVANAVRVGRIGGLHSFIRPVYADVTASKS